MQCNAHRVAAALAVMILMLSAVSEAKRPGCKTKQPSRKRLEEVSDRLSTTRMRTLDDESKLKFPLAFHIIHKTDGTGRLSEKDCRDQVDVLNRAYAGQSSSGGIDSRMTFYFESLEYIPNNQWYGDGCEKADTTFKKKHNKDLTKIINVYTCSGSGYLGWSTIPSDYAEKNPAHAIVIASDSFPNQGNKEFGEGDTVVHEIGHFLGLLHTFSNGKCSEQSGDGVADTPLQKSATNGCPLKRDSCPSSPGLDPIDNFMDYSSDSCMNKFTRGQIDRMRRTIKTYKPLLVANSHNDDDGPGPTPPPPSPSPSPSPTTTTTTKAPVTTEAPSKQCKPSQWRCSSGKQCIKKKWKCDGVVDCEDSSDESDQVCTSNPLPTTSPKPLVCKASQWSCNSGQKCIKKSWKCDGIKDCGDGSDESESECDTGNPPPTITTSPQPRVCKPSQWSCSNGQKCIKKKWKCDGVKDCNDGSDESDSECAIAPTKPSPCSANKWACDSGECIKKNWVCDGIIDCADKSDEKGSCNNNPFRKGGGKKKRRRK